MNIIGISGYYHDSAAALVSDGKIIAAAQEERFSRKKHDPAFPRSSIEFCLQAGGIDFCDVDWFVFYDKPLIKFERLLETYLAYAPKGLRSFLAAMPIWLKEKLYLKDLLRSELAKIAGFKKRDIRNLLFAEHHQSHAASAFFPSPFKEAAVLCMDGVGEWATTSVWLGRGNSLQPQWDIEFPHSLGLLYSAFTYYTGFKVNSGEYKLMGLAPYGQPKYANLIKEHLIDIKDDGTFRLNMHYFDFATGLRMTNRKFDQIFGGEPRGPESEITQREMDLAASVQQVTEEVVLKLAKTVKLELGVDQLCLAGGVALNCVSNGLLDRSGLFDEIWIQPASGDAGGAIGAALSVWYEHFGNDRDFVDESDVDYMAGAYLGPKFGNDEIIEYLDAKGASYAVLEDVELFPKVARILAAENVVGWFQGRMEFGPRALGGRSILGDPRSDKLQSVMNLKIKFRESFRPFAPSIAYDKVSDWFDGVTKSPYMLIVSPVNYDRRVQLKKEQEELFGLDKLHIRRSEIPAVTHVDYSARVQTVHPDTNPRYYSLIKEFETYTGCPILVNTSFNVRGEPIVCTPEDAFKCFMQTEMDYLVMENVLLSKRDQSAVEIDQNWLDQFDLD